MSYITGQYAFPISSYLDVNTSITIPTLGYRYVIINNLTSDIIVTLPDLTTDNIVRGYTLTIYRVDTSSHTVTIQTPQNINTFNNVSLSAGQQITILADVINNNWNFGSGYVITITTARELFTLPPGQASVGMIIYNTVASGPYTTGLYVFDGIVWNRLDVASGTTVHTSGVISGDGSLLSPIILTPGVNGDVLIYTSGAWTPAMLGVAAPLTGNGVTTNIQITPGTVTGMVLMWTGVAWTEKIIDTVGPIIGTGASGDGIRLNTIGVNVGDVLNYNGATWGTGNIATTGFITGNGFSSAIQLRTTGNTTGDVIQWNGVAWTGAQIIASVATSGLITGTGTIGNPVVFNNASGTNGNLLARTGGVWTPQNLSVGPALTGNGVTSSLNVIPGITSGDIFAWSGLAWAPTQLSTGFGITGNGVTTPLTLPTGTTGQILTWSAGNWIAAPPGATTVVTDATKGITGIGTSVDKVRLVPGIAGQVMATSDGTSWAPMTLSTSGLITGNGISGAITTNNGFGIDNTFFVKKSGTWQAVALSLNTAEFTGDGIGTPLGLVAGTTGQVLSWDGVNWTGAEARVKISATGGLVGNGTTGNGLSLLLTGTSGSVMIYSGTVWNSTRLLTTGVLTGYGFTGAEFGVANSTAGNALVFNSLGICVSAPLNFNTTLFSGNAVTTQFTLSTTGVVNGNVLAYNAGWIRQSIQTANGLQGDGITTPIVISPAISGNVLTSIGSGTWTGAPIVTSGALTGNGVNTNIRLKDGTGDGYFYRWDAIGQLWQQEDIMCTTPLSGTGRNSDPIKISPGIDGNYLQYTTGGGWASAPATVSVVATGGLSGVGSPGSPLGLLAAQTDHAVLYFNSALLNWESQVLTTTSPISGNGISSPIALAPGSTGNLLFYTGTQWAPQNITVSGTGFITGTGYTGSGLSLQTGITTGDYIRWTGTQWASQSMSTSGVLTGLGTVASPLQINPTGATNGNILVYLTIGGWQYANILVGTSLTGNGVTGAIDIPSSTDGYLLTYSSGSGRWIGAPPGAVTVITSGVITGNGTGGNPITIQTTGATNGNILVYLTAGGWQFANILVGNSLTGNGVTSAINIPSSINGYVLTYSSGTGSWSGAPIPASTVVTSGFIIGNGSSGTPIKLTDGTSFGDAIRWTGTAWSSQPVTVQLATFGGLTGNGTAGAPIQLATGTLGNVMVYKTVTGNNQWIPTTLSTTGVITGDGVLTGFNLIAGSVTNQVPTWNNGTTSWGLGSPLFTVSTSGVIDGDGTGGNPVKMKTSGVGAGTIMCYPSVGTGWVAQTFLISSIFTGNGSSTSLNLAPTTTNAVPFYNGSAWGFSTIQIGTSLSGNGFSTAIDIPAGNNNDLLTYSTGSSKWINAPINVSTSGIISGNGTSGTPVQMKTSGVVSGNIPLYTGGAWGYGQSLSGYIYYVDAVNGNNSTASPYNELLPYLTIDAAVTAAATDIHIGSGVTIFVRPGVYTVAINLAVNGLIYYFMPKASVSTGTTDAFGFSSDITVQVYGAADFILTGSSLFVNISNYVSTNISLYFEANSITTTSANQVFFIGNNTYTVVVRVAQTISNTIGQVFYVNGAADLVVYADTISSAANTMILSSGSISVNAKFYVRKMVVTTKAAIALVSVNTNNYVFCFDEIVATGSPTSSLVSCAGGTLYLTGRSIRTPTSTASNLVICTVGTIYISGGCNLTSGSSNTGFHAILVGNSATNSTFRLDCGIVQGINIGTQSNWSVTGYVRELFNNGSASNPLQLAATTAATLTGVMNLDVGIMYRTGTVGASNSQCILINAQTPANASNVTMTLTVREFQHEPLLIAAASNTNFNLNMILNMNTYNKTSTVNLVPITIGFGNVIVNFNRIVVTSGTDCVLINPTVNNALTLVMNGSLLQNNSSGTTPDVIDYTGAATVISSVTFNIGQILNTSAPGCICVDMTEPATSYFFFNNCFIKNTATGSTSYGCYISAASSVTSRIYFSNCSISTSATGTPVCVQSTNIAQFIILGILYYSNAPNVPGSFKLGTLASAGTFLS